MTEALALAFEQVFLDPAVWLIVIAAAVYGVFIGAVPGLTATMAIALMVPLTYWLPPVPALAAIVSMVACAIFAGDIPAVLLRIPGTPASAAYADEAHRLAVRGQADRVLGLALVSSIVGGLFGAIVLMLLGHQLAKGAAWFSASEYFWLYLLGLSCAVVVSRGAMLKGLLGVLIGLLLATVGLSAVHTQARFTFGQSELYQGIGFIPAMIGLFGVSEVLRNLLRLDLAPDCESDVPPPMEPEGPQRGWVRRAIGPASLMIRSRPVPALRSGTIGALIGMLPGAGADIASWVSLAASKRSRPSTSDRQSKAEDPDRSALEGISDATTANSAALAGAWIPALVFGIPGDSVTAIVIGVLLMKDISPGPEIFEKQAALVYSLDMVFLLSNLVLLPIGLLAIRAGGLVVRVPRRVLLPVILLFCVVGSYAINGSPFDVGVMLGMGLLGFLLERRGVPLGPVVLGIILGGPLEERLIQTLTGADGSPLAFVDRPMAAVLGLAWFGLWALAIFRKRKRG
ncbi:tripartite tricarboxylate transporter permease [soil metagenome]